MQTHISHVINRRDPDRPWSLRWQAATMPAPAFWYFQTEADATAAERGLHRTGNRNPGEKETTRTVHH